METRSLATITRFDNAKTLQGKRFSLEWSRLFERLCHPALAKSKMDLALWAPTIWPKDSRREGSEPIELCALVLDLDHGATLSGGLGAIQDGPMACLHTSWRHQHEVEVKEKVEKDGKITLETKRVKEDRFRLVFPLASPVAAARYPLVWRSADRWMREKHGLHIDGQTKNAGRCWFVPAHAEGYPFEAYRNDGPLLDPWLLVEKWPTLREVPPPIPPRWTEGNEGMKLKRATAYLSKMPASVSGQDGHKALWKAALILIKGFKLDAEVAKSLLLSDFNPRCDPPWTEREIVHKVKQAINAQTESGFIRDRDRK